MKFDLTVSLGSVINLLTFLVIAFAGAKRLGSLEMKITTLWKWFEKEHDIR